MNIGIHDVDIVKKNSNNFSFSKEILNEIVNEDFKQGAKEFYQKLSTGNDDTSRSYIWTALSAVTDDVGEILYQNVLNYIDNVSDIDTCTTKALQSMVKLLGTNYNILDGINDIPLELVNLIDVFSMRRECLVNSKYVNEQLAAALSSSKELSDLSSDSIQEINSYRETELSDNSELSVPLSVTQYVDIDKLDDFMSASFTHVITHFLTLTYGKMVEDKPIVEVLSDNILLSDFELPNKYQDKIDEYKTRWHIAPDFKPEDAVDNIEAGLSTMDDYQQKYQGLLSIEYERETAPLNKLEPMTRYAYFKEKKVKEYYQFIQNQYMRLFDAYYDAAEYEVDKTYLNVTGNKALAVPLLNSDGKSFNSAMVNAVVKNLILLVHKLQDLREYLKSHAQRTYMKGTFLLISYAVNEYLKQNVYPTMQQLHQATDYLSVKVENGESSLVSVEVPKLEYSSDDNRLKLTEYIDQTQYFNLQTDVDQLSTARFSTLNGKFWKNENTTNGAGTFVDSTNILNSADKSQIILSKSMQLDQIADFYESILPKSNNKSDNGKQYINNFLTSVFSSGADDSWWSDAHKKVMATLSDQTHTIDIDDYVAEVKTARTDDLTELVLSGFEPSEGATVKMQLDEARSKYIDRLSTSCDNFVLNVRNWLEEQLQNLDDLISQLENYYSSFENLDSRCNALYNAYASETTGFVQDHDYLLLNLNAYNGRASENLDNISSRTIINRIVSQSNSLAANHSSILTVLKAFCQNAKYLSKIYVKNDFDVLYPDNLNIADIIKVQYSYLSSVDTIFSTNYYEVSYDTAYNLLQKTRDELVFAIEDAMSKLLEKIKAKLDVLQLDSFDKLSCLLSSYDFYSSKFSLLDTVQEVSAALDYTNDEWYKYKAKLFMKYTGQIVGDTPYYYLENKVHPSYQIHPCLSNFIEKVDFSYPIMNLGGMADDVLTQYEGTLADSLLDGYLTGMWKNPLNSNTDYLVRYEQTDHTDSNLSANEYFGWDGLIHPKTFTNEGLSPDNNANLANFKERLSVVLSGQNLLEEEFDRYVALTQNYVRSLYSQLSDYDIKQYGLDQYGNSYILLSGQQGSQLDGTLWFRPKNIPIPFLAFSYVDQAMDEDSLSCGAFSYVSMSNTSFKLAEPQQINLLADNTDPKYIIYTPKVIDFNFTQDNTMLFMNCKSRNSSLDDFVIFGKIVQSKDNINPIQWTFLQDEVSRYETLHRPTIDGEIAAPWKFKSWFTQRTEFGAIYVDEQPNGNSSVYNICVSKFDRQLTHLTASISSTISSPDRVSSNQIYVDCDINGNIAVAYNVNVDKYSGKAATLIDGSQQYIGTEVATDGILSEYCTTTFNSIQVQYLQVAGKSIFQSPTKTYKPMQEAGFILATNNTVLARTGYIDELDENKVLKFQLAVPASEYNTGIDFRHVCPVRQVEGYVSGNRSNYTDNESYHSDGSTQTPLSGVLTGFSNVHFLESVYNQYLATMNDEQYYELVDAERAGRQMPDKSVIQANLDYLQLAHYDVSKYLSALKSEEKELDDELGISEKLKHRGLVSPYMMIDNFVPTTYKFGIYSASQTEVQTAFKNDRTNNILNDISTYSAVITLADNEQLSVRWIDRGGKIKLDFNSLLYLNISAYQDNIEEYLPEYQTGFAYTLSGQQDVHSSNFQFNERNKRNMFLNLDEPGEAGILNTWRAYESDGPDGTTQHYMDYLNTWLIKNISEEGKPKFLIAKVTKNQLSSASQLAGIQFNKAIVAGRKGASIQQQEETYLLAAEGPILRYISYE